MKVTTIRPQLIADLGKSGKIDSGGNSIVGKGERLPLKALFDVRTDKNGRPGAVGEDIECRGGSESVMGQPEVIEIDLPICHNESGRPGTEVIEAECIGPKHFRLLFSPGVVEGLAKGDIIELSETDPKGFNVVTRSGNLCVWFYFKDADVNRGPDGDRVRAAVEKFGGICDGGGNTNLVFSIPISLGFPLVEELFNDLVELYPGSSWLFGNVYDPWNEFKPLRWWE